MWFWLDLTKIDVFDRGIYELDLEFLMRTWRNWQVLIHKMGGDGVTVARASEGVEWRVRICMHKASIVLELSLGSPL